MTVDHHIYNAWLGGAKIDGANFLHNSHVEVVAGEYKGATGSVVSLIAIGANARYIVETETGFDIEVSESEIGETNS